MQWTDTFAGPSLVNSSINWAFDWGTFLSMSSGTSADWTVARIARVLCTSRLYRLLFILKSSCIKRLTAPVSCPFIRRARLAHIGWLPRWISTFACRIYHPWFCIWPGFRFFAGLPVGNVCMALPSYRMIYNILSGDVRFRGSVTYSVCVCGSFVRCLSTLLLYSLATCMPASFRITCLARA